MGYSIQKLVDVLVAEDGYLEKKKNCPTSALYEKTGNYVGADNWVKEWKDLADAGLANYQGSYWCIASIFWGMMKAYGLSAAQSLCLQKFMINCQETYNLFKAKKQVYSTPKIGDIAVFWSGTRFHHAELVISVKGDTVKTVGFNTSAITTSTVYNGGGCRANKAYSLAAMQKAGHKFCRPNYGDQSQEGWITDSKGTKYMLSDGNYVSSVWKYIDNKYYVFDDAGYLISGWFLSSNQWYYMCPEMVTDSWKLVDGKWYYLDESGIMHTGWLQLGNDWYYLLEDGSMVSDTWKKINDIWYVFDNNGKMLSNTWFSSDGEWYYLSSTGAMTISQWRQDKDGKYYYLSSTGKMAKDVLIKDKLEEVYYYVDTDGVWDEKSIYTLDKLSKTIIA